MAATHHHTHAPNHHGHFRGFSGASGLLIGLTMAVGRQGDAELACRLAGVGPGDRVVDVGCGPGAAVRLAARRGASVTGVDPAAVMRRLAGVLTPSRARARISYVDGAAEQLPLPDDSATVLWSIAAVHHWPDLGAGLAEARRVLEPGSRFVAIERHTRPGATGLASHGWTDEQVAAFADACRTAGFQALQVEHGGTRRRRVVAVVATNG